MAMSQKTRNLALGVALTVAALSLVKYLGESEMRRLDREMVRLCAIDGKSVIYETVTLPAEKFNQFGQPLVPYRRDDTGFGYYVQGSQRTVDGRAQEPGARLLRYEWRVLRTTDGKLLAEHIHYTRGGGDWQEWLFGLASGWSCPGPVPADFEQRIFIRD